MYTEQAVTNKQWNRHWLETWLKFFDAIESGETVWNHENIRDRGVYSFTYLNMAIDFSKPKTVNTILNALGVPSDLSVKQRIAYTSLNL